VDLTYCPDLNSKGRSAPVSKSATSLSYILSYALNLWHASNAHPQRNSMPFMYSTLL
jgi:hypothetical protein